MRKFGAEAWERSGILVLLLPTLLLLLLVYLLPLGRIAMMSVEWSAMSTEHYRALAVDDIFARIFLRTLWIALVVTLLCLLIGYPVAVLIAKADRRWTTLLILLVIIPMWTSVLVRSYAWMVILGREGIANSILQMTGLTDAPARLLYNRFAVFVGMVHIMLPFMILPILNTVRQFPKYLGHAALSLGGSPFRTFALVYLPFSLPGIVAGSTLVFILSLGFFVTPALLGGTTDTTFVLLIDRYVRAIRDWEMAAAMSMVLLLVMLAVVTLTQYGRPIDAISRSRPSGLTRAVYVLSREAVTLSPRKPPLGAGAVLPRHRQSVHGIGRWTTVLGTAGLMFLSLPLVIIVILAFSDSPFLKFPPTGFSLRWFENFFARPDWLKAAWSSVQVGFMTMILATLCGTLASIALVRGEFRGKALLYGFLISPIVVPVIVLAIAVYFVFSPLGLVGTRVGLVLAHSVLAIPYVIVVVTGALRSIDTMPERAARTLGAPPHTAFLRITLPALRPAVVAASFFAFLASFDELVIALFIAGTGSRTLPKRMWEGIREEIDPTIAAVAAMLIALTLALILAADFVRGRSRLLSGKG